MHKTGWVWLFYRFLFLDLWHRRFFHLQHKPDLVDFTSTQKDEYLQELNLSLKLVDKNSQLINELPKSPTLYYGNHPSSLDALFVYFALFKKKPWIVSFIHNQLHFSFLKKRTIPVGAKLAAKKITPLGLKMKLACRLEKLSDEECRQINLGVPAEVVQKLLKGQDVVIFPSGGWGKWQDGIGFAIDLLYQQNQNAKINLQPLKIVSFREAHSVLHGWLHIFGFKIPGVVKIKLGDKKKIKDLSLLDLDSIADSKIRAKKIRSWLEADYQRL